MLLAYSILLSQLLVKNGVDTSNTEVWETTEGDELNKAKLESFGYYWNGHWHSNPFRLSKEEGRLKDPTESEERLTRNDIREREGIEVPGEAESDSTDQPPHRWRMPIGNRPLT